MHTHRQRGRTDLVLGVVLATVASMIALAASSFLPNARGESQDRPPLIDDSRPDRSLPGT